MASRVWKIVSVGLASASFCRIVRARSNDASAAARVAGLILDRADHLIALRQVALESSDGRVGVGESCKIARACSSDASAGPRLPGLLVQEADVVVALRQVALELRCPRDRPRPASD